jgi:hypothetical protein
VQMGDRQTERCLVVADGRRVNQVKQLLNVDRSKRMMVLSELEGLGGGRSWLISCCLGDEGSLVPRQCPVDNSHRVHEWKV